MLQSKIGNFKSIIGTSLLLGYMTLLIESHLEHAIDGWMGYNHRFKQIATISPMLFEHKLIQPYGTLPFQANPELSDARLALASHILQQNATGHQTKGHLPQELITNSNHQHNLLPPTFNHLVAAEYSCFITMRLPQDVPSQNASSNMSAISVLRIYTPLIRTTKS